jgi:hypothetical protein
MDAVSINARPLRPVTSDDPPIFYGLPAESMTAGMTAITDDGGFDIDAVDVGDDLVTYMVAMEDGVTGLPVVSVKRTAERGALVDLATFWDTPVDGSVLPEAVDVRTR